MPRSRPGFVTKAVGDSSLGSPGFVTRPSGIRHEDRPGFVTKADLKNRRRLAKLRKDGTALCRAVSGLPQRSLTVTLGRESVVCFALRCFLHLGSANGTATGPPKGKAAATKIPRARGQAPAAAQFIQLALIEGSPTNLPPGTLCAHTHRPVKGGDRLGSRYSGHVSTLI